MALDKDQLVIMKAELTADPLGRGYSSMDSQQVADDLKTEYRSRVKALMTATEVFQNIDKAEFLALADGHQNLVMNIMGFGSINPAGREAEIFVQLFGAQSQTVQAVAQARQEPVSRAVELGVGGVRAGDVDEARK